MADVPTLCLHAVCKNGVYIEFLGFWSSYLVFTSTLDHTCRVLCVKCNVWSVETPESPCCPLVCVPWYTCNEKGWHDMYIQVSVCVCVCVCVLQLILTTKYYSSSSSPPRSSSRWRSRRRLSLVFVIQVLHTTTPCNSSTPSTIS